MVIDVNLKSQNLEKLPKQKKEVNGDFDCSHNNLTSLEGCPEIINDNFFCGYNNLTSLKDSPKYIKNNYYCNNNNLENLKDSSVVNWMREQTKYSTNILKSISNRKYYIDKRQLNSHYGISRGR